MAAVTTWFSSHDIIQLASQTASQTWPTNEYTYSCESIYMEQLLLQWDPIDVLMIGANISKIIKWIFIMIKKQY